MPIAILDWHPKRQKLLDAKTLKKIERFWMPIEVPDWCSKTAEIIRRENAQILGRKNAQKI